MEQYPKVGLFLLFWVSLRVLFSSCGSRFLWLVWKRRSWERRNWERRRNQRKETKKENEAWKVVLIPYFVRLWFVYWILKIQKYYFHSTRPWGHLEQSGTTRLGIGAPEVLFPLKWPQCSWSALDLTEGQMRSKLPQKNFFHRFTPNPSFSKIFNNFEQVWPKVDLRWA